MSSVQQVQTPAGPARLHWSTAAAGMPSRGLVVLGHGAGGGVEAADLQVLLEPLTAGGWDVALAEQPWRVAGRRVAPAPARLDAAWLPLVAAARAACPGGRLVVGGRSAGARVACRTAAAVGADAVVLVAFPWQPPSSRADRSAELADVVAQHLPVLVVQGQRDPFGRPERISVPGVRVVGVPGTHGFTEANAPTVAAAVTAFLDEVAAAGRPAEDAVAPAPLRSDGLGRA